MSRPTVVSFSAPKTTAFLVNGLKEKINQQQDFLGFSVKMPEAVDGFAKDLSVHCLSKTLSKDFAFERLKTTSAANSNVDAFFTTHEAEISKLVGEELKTFPEFIKLLNTKAPEAKVSAQFAGADEIVFVV